MVIQYGYMTLFASAFPLAATIRSGLRSCILLLLSLLPLLLLLLLLSLSSLLLLSFFVAVATVAVAVAVEVAAVDSCAFQLLWFCLAIPPPRVHVWRVLAAKWEAALTTAVSVYPQREGPY